jgi:predicted glycogen debranching enzyme
LTLIAFGPDVCQDWQRATSREWLETNGLGGYASSTIIGANTRRYHGLLIAALRPPSQRTLLLSKLEDTLVVGDTDYDLSCNQYPGAIYPQGHRYLAEFRLDPFPTFVYEVPTAAPVRLEKTVAVCRGLNAVIVRYRLMAGPGTVSLVIRPIVNCRDHHHLMRENASFETRAEISGARDCLSMQPYAGVPPLHLQFEGAYFEPYGDWYRAFEYAQEAARGLDYVEDQYSPGYFSCGLDPGESRHLVASIEEAELEPAAALDAEAARRRSTTAGREAAPEEIRQLLSAADAFVVRGESSGTGTGNGPGASPRGIIAGYHWFEEWGRDAMISLPGIALVTGRFDAAKRILRAYAGNCKQGLIPNRIPNTAEEADYNTADATLWMLWAIHKYLDYTGDQAFVRGELLSVLLEIIEWHVRGTRFGIGADEDGLLRAGGPDSQLTWMDAKVGEWVVTPRQGKAVEINALWHHALRFVEELGAAHAGPSADSVGEAFRARFWNEQVGYLNDVVDSDTADDASLRPNQIIALSLPYPILEAERARRVLAVVERELLTPYGLRTLSPSDSRYRGRYVGDQWSRDSAYHQGTVWPWLLGPFITAYVSFAPDKAAARRTARAWLQPIWEHLREAGLGFASEVFDGDEPHHPGGCIAQAWSIAEILRAAVEDLGLGAAGV